MKFYKSMLALALVASTAAYANPINSVGVSNTGASGTMFAFASSPVTATGYSFNPTGAFTEDFLFNLDAVQQFSVSMTNSYTISTGEILFFSAVLTPPGVPTGQLVLDPGPPTQTLAGSFGPLSAGLYTLTVTGTAAGDYGATYGMSAAAVPVPEPETYALLLAGLGVVGFMASRRKPQA